MEIIFRKIARRIEMARRILLLGHRNPDGDACGALLAMRLYLNRLGKEAAIFTPNAAPGYFSFLPGWENISSNRNLLETNWDLAIALDISDLSLAAVTRENLNGAPLVCFDHHRTNSGYADLNAIDCEASSTCEIISDYFSFQNLRVDKQAADCLLTGILNDTGGFSNAATTGRSIAKSSSMMVYGANLCKIASHSWKNKTVNGLRLWGATLARLRLNKKYGIAYTYITKKEIDESGASEEEIDGLSNFLNSLADAPVCMVIKILDDEVKFSMRAPGRGARVDELAWLFGGGGHKKAAGFSVSWPMSEINGSLLF